jgi:hypothetical protein
MRDGGAVDIERIARMRSRCGALISLYLNRPPGPSSAAVTDLLKPIRSRLERLPRETAMSVREDLARLGELDARIDAEMAPAYCAFASHADDVFEFHLLPHPVWDVATVGRRAYVRPLRAMPEPIRAGVVVAERRKAEVYLAEDGEVDRVGAPIVGHVKKDNFGGFQGYDEHNVRRHAEEDTARILKEAGDRLFEAHQRKPLDLLVVGGHQADLDMLDEHLHAYLRALPIRRFVVDPHTLTEARLRELVEEAAEELRRSRDEEAARRVLEAAGSGEPAALGVAKVLEATNARAVELAVVAGTFTREGVMCPRCGWLHRQEQTCAVCGNPTEEVDDVIGAAWEAILEAGGTVRQLRTAGQIDAHGVAALLRFPV